MKYISFVLYCVKCVLMNVNKGVSLNSETRIPHEARILRYHIIAFLMTDAEGEIWLLNAVIIFLLHRRGKDILYNSWL